MKNLKVLTTLVFVTACAGSVLAFDRPVSAAVEIVEGVSIAEVTQMDFGQVADHDGALTITTDAAVAMTDPAFISYDDTGYTPGIFTCTSIPGASVNCAIVNDADVAGLTLSAFAVSVEGGADEGDLTDITQIASDDTWNIGATLTVAAATAVEGAHTPGYTITITLN